MVTYAIASRESEEESIGLTSSSLGLDPTLAISKSETASSTSSNAAFARLDLGARMTATASEAAAEKLWNCEKRERRMDEDVSSRARGTEIHERRGTNEKDPEPADERHLEFEDVSENGDQDLGRLELGDVAL